MKRIKVNVTAQDISRGKRADCERCPIAIALRRICVGDFWVGDEIFCADIRIKTPPKPLKFIAQFDAYRVVKPFTFTLNVPDEWVRKGGGK